MTIKMIAKRIFTHGALATLTLSLSFCAPPVQDFGSGIHKFESGDDPQDAYSDYNEQVCEERGGTVDVDGSCSTTFTTAGFSDACQNPTSQEQIMACNEQEGIEENGGQFWGALLAVVGKEVLSTFQYVRNQNLHGQWLKNYVGRTLNVFSPGGIPLDLESKLNDGNLTKHSLGIHTHSASNRGRSSIQIELEATGNSIITLKSKAFGKVEYGKTLLMCLNASYVHNSGSDSNNNDDLVALQMRAKYNSHIRGSQKTKEGFYATCNQNNQEHSYLAFQLHNSNNYHMFVFNPKDMGFSKANNSNNSGEPDNFYNVTLGNGNNKKFRYYVANNNLDLKMSTNNHVTNAFFTDNSNYSIEAIENQKLSNVSPGGSYAESNYNNLNFPSKTDFQKRYLHLVGSDSVPRKFCNQNQNQVGCQFN